MADDELALRLVGIFVDELDEQLMELNDDLLALERTPDDPERLRSVFRVMHTLKGAARASGLRQIEDVCHALESELAVVRDRKATLTGARIALLFEAADALAGARDELRAGRPLSGSALSSLLHHARAREAAGAQPDAPRAVPIPIEPEAKENPMAVRPAAAGANILEAVETPAPPVRAEDPSRGEHVRVTLGQVDSIAAAAGEIAGAAAQATDRGAEAASLRSRWREYRTMTSNRQLETALDRDIIRLARHLAEDARAIGTLAGRLGDSARQLRQRPFSDVTNALPRMARDVAHELGRQVSLVIIGGEIEADRVVLEALREPLGHLVRNAVDHGIAPPAARIASGKGAEGEIRVEATLRGDRLRITVSDDGRGLDLSAIRQRLIKRGLPLPEDRAAVARSIFTDGFTTRDVAGTVSGRGVGLGIVSAAAERIGGTYDVVSNPAKGTTFVIDVPLSVATLRGVIVEVGGVRLGIPSAFVVRALRVDPRTLVRSDGRTMLRTPDGAVPATTLAELLGPPFASTSVGTMLQMLLLENGATRLAVAVDDIVEEREMVLRPVENVGDSVLASIVGTALASTGEVIPVLSVPALAAVVMGTGSVGSRGLAVEPERARTRILVVDDSMTSRALEQSVLNAAGYDVTTAVNGLEAWQTLEKQTFALVVSDIEMPRLDGIELCKRVRGTPRTANLPLILVTSLDQPEQRARGLDAGADAYITKSSFDQDTLLETVRMLVGSGRTAAS